MVAAEAMRILRSSGKLSPSWIARDSLGGKKHTGFDPISNWFAEQLESNACSWRPQHTDKTACSGNTNARGAVEPDLHRCFRK